MRTTLTLEDDVHKLAAAYAEARGITLGAAVGELLRRSQATSAPVQIRRSPKGIPLFTRQKRVLTSALVKEALEQDDE